MQEEKAKAEYIKELKNEKRKSQRRALWIIILIIIIILLLCFCYLMFNKLGKIGYEQTSSEIVDSIQITENDIDINKIEDLNIFCNPEFGEKKMIAPQSYSTYNFKIENVTNNNIKYNISMEEINRFNINMKYKLKLDNIYIIGNKDEWVDAEKLNINDVIVTADSRNIYTLEWYWADAENDTDIGKAVYAEYKLNINISAQNVK